MAIDLQSLQEYDKLSDEVKAQFRKYNIDFYYPAWSQCVIFANDENEAFQMFKKIYESL